MKVNESTVVAFIDFGSEVTLAGDSLVTNPELAYDNVPSTLKGSGDKAVPSIDFKGKRSWHRSKLYSQ